jgi:predicted lipoprotein with Yx(FWY)xxD motif
MPRPTTPRPHPLPIRIGLLAAALAVLLGATAAQAGQASKRVVEEAENATLGRTVLTNLNGRTLYSLSVEKNGHFVCTGVCLSSWRPLLIPKGVKPKGPVKLSTVQRPNGKVQVTYKGRPLYRFYGDPKAGEANGEGIKDVGTWHAATVGDPNATPPAESEPPYPYRAGPTA